MRRPAAVTAAVLLALVCVTGPTSAAPASPGTWGTAVRLEQQVVEASGVSTAYAVLGPPSARALLLLNGTGSPMAQWDPALLEGLARARRVVVYDYPGLGGSRTLSAPLTLNALADHANGLLTALGIQRADILGWSMGGFVAQRLAVRHPDRVRSLVLAATNPGGTHAVLGPTWVQDQDSDADGTVRGYVRTNYPAAARGRGWAFVRRVNAAITEGRYPTDRVPAATYDAMVGAEDGWLASDVNARQLAGLSMPVLVITGSQDVVTPPQNSRFLARRIPGAMLRLIPDAGHSFLFQDPYRTIDVIDDAMSRLS